MILGNLPLLHIVKNEEVLAALLEYNVDLEQRDEPGNTMLNQLAVRIISGEMVVSSGFVARLLDAGADIESVNDNGDTPVIRASTVGNIAMLRVLSPGSPTSTEKTHAGAPLSIKPWRPGISIASDSPSSMVETYITPHPLFGTLLQFSVGIDEGQDMVKFLVEEHLVNVNDNSNVHNNMIGQACLQASLPVLTYLLGRGGSALGVDRVGMPVVFVACFRQLDTLEVIKILVRHGARFSSNVRDRLGRTMLYCAVLSGNLPLLDYVLEAEPDLLTSRDYEGWTALHWALRSAYLVGVSRHREIAVTGSQQTEVVRYLLDRGCPGLEPTVSANQKGWEWNALCLAKYHKVPQTVIIALTEKSLYEKLEDVEAYRTAALYGEAECSACYCAVRGKIWTCQAKDCYKGYSLCFRCIPSRNAVHDPTHGHFREHGEEFEGDAEKGVGKEVVVSAVHHFMERRCFRLLGRL
ncbi:ankyrin repeat-containing domain protein, partial [Coniochaeta sp. 2T2.1]